MATPSWIEGARIGMGLKKPVDENDASQNDLLVDPRRAIPQGTPRPMGEFPRLTLTEADAPRGGPMGMDPSLPMAPESDFQTFANNGPAPTVPMGRAMPQALPRLGATLPQEMQDDPRAAAMNSRMMELTRPGAQYDAEQQMKLKLAAQKSVDEEVGGKAALGRDRLEQQRKNLEQRTTHDADMKTFHDANTTLRKGDQERKNRHEVFAQSMGVHRQNYEEAHNYLRDQLDEVRLSLTERQHVLDEFDRITKNAIERGEAMPDPRWFFQKASDYLSATPNPQQQRILDARGAAPDMGVMPAGPALVPPTGNVPQPTMRWSPDRGFEDPADAGPAPKQMMADNDHTAAQKFSDAGHARTPAQVSKMRAQAKRDPSARAKWMAVVGSEP